MGQALVTDLYELNMVASYLRRGMTGPATFSLFARDLPAGRGFLVAAGLHDCLDYLESVHFTDEDLAWLRRAGFGERAVSDLAGLRFAGDVDAVPEGRVVLPGEPLLEVTAPLPQAQLAETFLLNQVTFQTAIATKATRCRLAAGGIELVDFALRRAHGLDAGMAVARVSAIAGFAATSNVEAARRYGLSAAGTMAHSYVEAFPDERAAFRAYAQDRPGRLIFLVDTYDTVGGVANAIAVIRELRPAGPVGVRLDSGDLAALARRARAMLDEAGLPDAQIFVSGGLDEHDLALFRDQGAPIDAAGVGTRMGVSADAPSLDTAYKLVAYDGRPVLKLSEGKATLPGPKQVWRSLPIQQDVLATRDEPAPAPGRSGDERGPKAPAGFEPLLIPMMRGGIRTRPPDTVDLARRRLDRDLAALSPAAKDLRRPEPPRVRISDRLQELTRTVRADVRRRSQAPGQEPR